jgi:hypothetical protein
MRWLLLVLGLVACKERGTISVDLTPPCASASTAVAVRFQVVKGGNCMQCNGCGGACPCDTTATEKCITGVDCDPACSLADAKMRGIEFDPPSPGAYSLTYHFFNAASQEISILCTDVTVESDGTTSSTAQTMSICCQ